MNTSIVPIATKEILKKTPEKIMGLVRENSVIVVPGKWDKVENVLSELSIPHSIKSDLSRSYLKPKQIIMVNCSDRIQFPAHQIQDFIESGGWLITSDWALDVIEQCFPRTIRYTGKSLPNDVIHVEPIHPQLCSGMSPCDFWIDGGSRPFQILDRMGVIPVITSVEMQKKYNTTPYICVGFQYGKGKVFHMVSHFILQKSKSEARAIHDNMNVIQFLLNVLAQKGIKNVSCS